MTAEQPSNVTGPAKGSAFRVALVCMPFQLVAGPSPAIGLLTAIAERSGFTTDSYHLNLDLAAKLEPGLYDALCQNHHGLVCEWLFGVAAFNGEVASDAAAYLAASPEVGEFITKLGRDTANLTTLRNEILPRFVDDCAASIDWGQYRVVGFTSSFQQNVASLALARRIKERTPEVAIVFGGTNMEGGAGEEYIRAFPFIDYVVVGDGDLSFPALLGGIASQTPLDGVPGLLMRTANGIRSTGAAQLFDDLDSLPTPDYDEFYQRARRLDMMKRGDCGWILPFEGSRGCWWGEKYQCTFCGFNTLGIAYRRKSPTRVFQELAELARRHGVTSFSATDSIMDMGYVEEWRRRWSSETPDTLVYRRTPGALFIEDNRGGQRRGTHSFRDPVATIYAACDETMRSPEGVWSAMVSEGQFPDLSESDVKEVMDEFCRLGLMVGDDGRYLSLAIPANPNW